MKKMKIYLFFFIVIKSILFSTEIGNPLSPKILKKGIFNNNKYISFRAANFYSNIYKSKYEDEILDQDSTPTYLSMDTFGAILTVNIKKRLEIYGILGGSKLSLEKEIKTNRNFAFGCGSKFLLFKKKQIASALDGKYFRTKQKTNYFIIEKKIFPIETTDFSYIYESIQAALSFSYQLKDLIPYIGISYLYSKIKPYPGETGIFRYPAPYQNMLDKFYSKDIKNSKKFGIVVGSSITAGKILNINLESRMIDQNEVSLVFDLRF